MKNIVLLITLIVSAMSAVELTDTEKGLLSHSVEYFRDTIYPPEVCRAFDVHRDGCPVCGDGIKKHGTYAWIISPDKPFKLQCPECKTVFPDNDFLAYLKSGFKDKSLLTGKYVDDGRGWRPGEGLPKYWFVAYYNHWSFNRFKFHAVLASAYARTGEKEFARMAAGMLDKYADYYKQYDYNKQSRYAEEVAPNYTGRILNAIWETSVSVEFVNAYENIKSFLNEPDEKLEGIIGKTNEQICQNIEDNMFRVMANDIMTGNGRNSGNFGMHQVALLRIAKVLKDTSMVKWVTDYRPTSRVASIPLDYAIYNNFFGDGAPLESPGYNRGWLNNVANMSVMLKENDVDEFKLHPVIPRIFRYWEKFYVCGAFGPSSGDSGDLSNRGYYSAGASYLKLLFNTTHDGIFAEMLRRMGNVDKETLDQIEGYGDPEMGYRSGILTGYGMATLQNGNHEVPTATVLAFPSYVGHRHNDMMDLSIFAENTPLTPDFGYPTSASGDDPLRAAFLVNTLVHNTVVVDSRKQLSPTAKVLRFDTGKFVQLVSVDCPGVYDGVDMYRRNVMTCEVAPGKTVIFDVFRVNGGKQHDWFMHGCGENFESDIDFSAPAAGTLAGEDVKYGEFYDAPELENLPPGRRSYGSYRGSGYQYLEHPQYGKTFAGSRVTLPAYTGNVLFNGNPGAKLVIYPLEDGGDIILSDGVPPITQKNPQKFLKFVTRRRVGEAPLNSVFGTILEASSDLHEDSDIVSVKPLTATNDMTGAVVNMKDGSVLYVFDSLNPVSFTADDFTFNGTAGALWISADGTFGKAFITGPGSIARNDKIIVAAENPMTNTVVSVNLAAESITMDSPVSPACIGHFFRVGNRSYIAGQIDGSTIKLQDQSSVRGRFRATKCLDSTRNRYAIMPPVNLASQGMSIYGGENRKNYEGQMTMCNGGSVECDNPLELNQDYWISECSPMDIVVFPSSNSVEFKIDEE